VLQADGAWGSVRGWRRRYAAIERKVAPRRGPYDNIAAMKKAAAIDGLSLIGFTRNSRIAIPLITSHQQKSSWDFLCAGPRRGDPAKINWTTVDMTVRANEQVIDVAAGWRSGAVGRAARDEPLGLQDPKYSQELLDGARYARPRADKVRGECSATGSALEGLLDPLGRMQRQAAGEPNSKIFYERSRPAVSAQNSGDRTGSSRWRRPRLQKHPKLARFLGAAQRQRAPHQESIARDPGNARLRTPHPGGPTPVRDPRHGGLPRFYVARNYVLTGIPMRNAGLLCPRLLTLPILAAQTRPARPRFRPYNYAIGNTRL